MKTLQQLITDDSIHNAFTTTKQDIEEMGLNVYYDASISYEIGEDSEEIDFVCFVCLEFYDTGKKNDKGQSLYIRHITVDFASDWNDAFREHAIAIALARHAVDGSDTTFPLL